MILIKRAPVNIISLFVCISIFSFVKTSEVTPEYSGEWFDEVIQSETKYSSCCEQIFKYKNKSSKQSLIAALFNNLPPSDTCTWGAPYFTDMNGGIPADFPGSPDQYDTIVASGGYPSQQWAVDCRYSGGAIENQINAVLYPSYRCPSGTRSDCVTGSSCAAKPLACIGDVVGRDLNVPGLGWIGHVGLVITPSQSEGLDGCEQSQGLPISLIVT